MHPLWPYSGCQGEDGAARGGAEECRNRFRPAFNQRAAETTLPIGGRNPGTGHQDSCPHLPGPQCGRVSDHPRGDPEVPTEVMPCPQTCLCSIFTLLCHFHPLLITRRPTRWQLCDLDIQTSFLYKWSCSGIGGSEIPVDVLSRAPLPEVRQVFLVVKWALCLQLPSLLQI